MLVEFLKTVWPRLRIGGRAPIPRSSFLQARNGTPLAARNSEVLLTR